LWKKKGNTKGTVACQGTAIVGSRNEATAMPETVNPIPAGEDKGMDYESKRRKGGEADHDGKSSKRRKEKSGYHLSRAGERRRFWPAARKREKNTSKETVKHFLTGGRERASDSILNVKERRIGLRKNNISEGRPFVKERKKVGHLPLPEKSRRWNLLKKEQSSGELLALIITTREKGKQGLRAFTIRIPLQKEGKGESFPQEGGIVGGEGYRSRVS